MTIKTNIVTTADFEKGLNSIGSRSKGLESKFAAVTAYVYNQATEHGNASPAMRLREELTTFVCKPKGFTQKGLDVWMETYVGFDKGKEKGSYRKNKSFQPVELPEQGVKFWQYKIEREAVEFSVSESLARVVKRAHKEGIEDTDIIEAISVVLNELSNPNDALANTLGVTENAAIAA